MNLFNFTLGHTALLWLLPLAAIPIILHLLTLFRLKTVELSTFRFLFDSYVQQRRRMQFLEALLAMLRTLFLLLLVFVFAKLTVKHWESLFQGGGSGGREVIILMDCSASMEADTEGKSALKRAKSAARAVVESLSKEDRVTLVRVAARSEPLFTSYSKDTNTIASQIDNLAATPGRANFFAAFAQLFGPGTEQRESPIVYVFTDCQASGWDEVRHQGLERVLPTGLQLIVVNVGSSEAVPNQAVLGDAPRGGRAVVGLPVYLHAKVKNYAREPAEVTLSTLIDGVDIARSKLTLKPGEMVLKKITYIPGEPGVHTGTFKISGNGADRFPKDDEYQFILSVVPRIKVLVVNGSPSLDPELSETLYLKALSHSGAADDRPDKKPGKDPGGLGSERDLLRSIDLREIAEPGLTPDALKDASVVILANCGGLNAQHFILLRDFVAAGGGLLIFPGDKVLNMDLYNTQFFPVPGVVGEYLIPVRLGAPEGDPANLKTFAHLESIDYSHPVMAVFDDPTRQGDTAYFKRVSFYRYFPLTIADNKAKGWTPLAEFPAGPPVAGSPDPKPQTRYALVEGDYGDGRVVVAAFPVNRAWSNLPTDNGKEFVPLMLRLISRVQHRPPLEAPLAVTPEGVVNISVTGAWNPAQCTVSGPKDTSPTPVALERSGSRLLGVFDRTSHRGVYTIEARSDRPDLNGKATLAFAVNLAPEESDFTMMNEEQFQKLLPTAKVTLVNASAEEQQMTELGNTAVAVWQYLIYGMFALIGIEFLLATLGGGRRRDAEENAGAAQRVHQVNVGSFLGRMTGIGAGRKAES
jgi:hypothetical protein